MAYYKVRIEVWCDWDPVASELAEIVENIRTGDAICTTSAKWSTSWIVPKISRMKTR